MTSYLIYSAVSSTRSSSDKNLCHCQTCTLERQQVNKTSCNRLMNQLIRPKFVFLVAGWLAVAFLAYQVSFAEAPKQHWDPYEILGISEGATLPEIKKVYKKLSLIYHPDKAQPGTEKESEEQFIQISKAYQVLTDEDVRKNYEQYGHPDGKQTYSVGVALPKKLVESGSSSWVLAFYACIFGFGLPFYTARWWYNSRRHTKDKILNASMRVFVKELKEDTDFKALLNILAGAHEFKENLSVQANEQEALKAIDNVIVDELEHRFGERFERAVSPKDRHKARSLLYAYFLRIDINKACPSHAKTLLREQQYIVERSIHLLQGLLQIAIVKQWLSVTSCIMEMQQELLQAIYPGESSVKQLPHVTTSLLRRYYRSKKKHIHSAKQVLSLSESERKNFLEGLSNEQSLDVVEVANRIPQLTVSKAVLKVVGDKIVTPGAIVTLVLKLRNGNATIKENEDEADDEDENDDQEELLDEGGKAKSNDKNGTLPFAHAPYYPGEKKPYWWIFLGDPKVNRILYAPKKVTDVTEEQTVQISFPGPPKPGTYTFSIYVKSDTYVGTDIMHDIKLRIHDKADLPPEEEVDDSISDPEEDSIAGQMKLMREQGLAGALAGGNAQNKAAKPADDDSDSDSSDDE
ncbi:hypothetical protein O0I10_008577 [Lichtheimia ornata]|uniref:J domain-containing protein n=1 Tax=Lichtheimia ornata TaxID=688661 RepID=A0AAD7UY87_9FUNG|nr:uncharacterized protein O0I10_008577 [Lichtheimia ornata]KAJ8655692.1 hypothetical protein O0I10_008577 [Lichtheimia ornata]